MEPARTALFRVSTMRAEPYGRPLSVARYRHLSQVCGDLSVMPAHENENAGISSSFSLRPGAPLVSDRGGVLISAAVWCQRVQQETGHLSLRDLEILQEPPQAIVWRDLTQQRARNGQAGLIERIPQG
jgi:hypothetical protein